MLAMHKRIWIRIQIQTKKEKKRKEKNKHIKNKVFSIPAATNLPLQTPCVASNLVLAIISSRY
jgi:hypothetical protein